MDLQLAQQAYWFISSLDKRFALNKNVGWIYAMRNKEFRRPLLKIGLTKTSPYQRARELGSATGVPGEFELVYFLHSSHCGKAEFYVHQKLAPHRTTGEFFEVPIRVAVEAMDEAAAHYPVVKGMARPKARKWDHEVLPQAFRHAVVECPDCGANNKVHGLAISFRAKCSICGRYLS